MLPIPLLAALPSCTHPFCEAIAHDNLLSYASVYRLLHDLVSGRSIASQAARLNHVMSQMKSGTSNCCTINLTTDRFLSPSLQKSSMTAWGTGVHASAHLSLCAQLTPKCRWLIYTSRDLHEYRKFSSHTPFHLFSRIYIGKAKTKNKKFRKGKHSKKKPDQCFNLIAIPLFATPLFFL